MKSTKVQTLRASHVQSTLWGREDTNIRHLAIIVYGQHMEVNRVVNTDTLPLD